MKHLALVLLALSAIEGCLVSCSPSLTPEQEAQRDFREARVTDDLKRRLELLDRAVELHPTPEAHLERAMLSETLRDPARAIADYTAAIRFVGDGPVRAALLLNRGVLYGKARRFDEGEADLSEAIKATGSPEAYLQRAWLRRQAGKAADAERDVAEARKTGNSLADPLYNEGVRAVTRGDSAEAERMFRFAIDLDPLHPRAHIAMARLHMERHRFADAVGEFDQAIPSYPRDAELYYHRGNAQLAAGRGDQALADYEKAVGLAPNEAIYLASRGMAWHRVRNDVAKAMVDFGEAIRIDPKCHTAWYHRGLLDHEQGHLEGAEQDLRRATSSRATPEGCVALGRVLHDRGEYDKALALFRGALEIYKEPETRKVISAEMDRTRLAKENRK
jgi:tetratricopeptide (TPR) repeat protein